MNTVKARMQGNATVVTIPKSFNVQPGTKFRVAQSENSALRFIPVTTIEELFEGWHGQYHIPKDLADWQNV